MAGDAVTIELTKDEARWLAVTAQGLDRRPRGKTNDARVLETIRKIAFPAGYYLDQMTIH